MKISSSDSSNSEVSMLLFTAALVSAPTVINIVAKRVLKSLSSEETADKYTPYITAIPFCFLVGYNISVFFGSLGIFIFFKMMTIPLPPRNSVGIPIWNAQMSCIIADKFIGIIQNNSFAPTEKFYQNFELEAPKDIQILDRFAYQPYQPKEHDTHIEEITQLHTKDAGSSVIHILQRLDTPLLEGIAPTLLEAYQQGANGVVNIKPAIENLEKHRLLLLRKIISHLHFVSQKPGQYNRSSQQLAEVFEPLLFGKLPQDEARIALLQHFIENPAVISPA